MDMTQESNNWSQEDEEEFNALNLPWILSILAEDIPAKSSEPYRCAGVLLSGDRCNQPLLFNENLCVIHRVQNSNPSYTLIPRSLWEELHPFWTLDNAFDRLDNIDQACERHISPPFQWEVEWVDLNNRLEIEIRWYCDPTGIMRSPLFRPIFRLFGFKGYHLPIENNSLN
jgi:hypothetical protein